VPYEALLNFEELLAPIPGDNPSGSNLLYAGVHDEVREARRADDVLEQGEWKHESKVSDWHRVTSLTTAAIATKTKDLQLAAWLTEALVNLHGFAGLHDGLKLIRGLLENFWDTLYPEIDEGDLEARANAIDMLNRPFFAAAVQKVPVTGNPIGANYSYVDFKDSARFDIPDNLDALEFEARERALQLKQLAATEGKITTEQWRVAKNASKRAFYEDFNSLLNMCWDESKALDDLLDAKFQRQTPGLTDFKKMLDAIRSTVVTILKEKRILEPDPVEAVADENQEVGADGKPVAGGGARASGPVGSRQDALRRLGEVAEFFRATEPHSPVAYLLDRAIHWGQMPLEAWLDEVIKDAGVLAHVRETLGLKAGGEGQ
jgi:type VI secretion system protein ImpA